MAFLVDTNILVYRRDPRFESKQRIAEDLFTDGLRTGELRVPYQGLVEFVSVTTRPRSSRPSLLSILDAHRIVEETLTVATVLFPNKETVRLAFRAMAAYGLSWFDSLIWAFAEQNQLSTLFSEDFQHGRVYGSVRIVNPFLDLAGRN